MQDCVCTGEIPSLKQGDAYGIPVHLFFNGEEIGAALLPMLDEIEFAFEWLEPVCIPAADAWSDALQCFLLPVTQAQTLALEEGRTTLDVRVKFYGGNVLGARRKAKIKVVDASSEEVI